MKTVVAVVFIVAMLLAVSIPFLFYGAMGYVALHFIHKLW